MRTLGSTLGLGSGCQAIEKLHPYDDLWELVYRFTSEVPALSGYHGILGKKMEATFRVQGFGLGFSEIRVPFWGPFLRTGVVWGSTLGSPFRETTSTGNPDCRCTWRFPNTRGRNFGGPLNCRYGILGSGLGSLILWKLPLVRLEEQWK